MPGEGCMSVELRDFLLKCVCKDPYERMPAEALLLHPFITKVLALPPPPLFARQAYTWPPCCLPLNGLAGRRDGKGLEADTRLLQPKNAYTTPQML